jgi:hypothetical protein
MPYQRKTARQPRRHLISYQDVCRANHTVIRELETLWFWHKRLDDVEVYWVATSWSCYGWYQGDIYIPAITGAQLSDLIQGRHIRLTDVLRHEWAHAVADKWPLVMNTKRFLTAFGGPYESGERVMNYDPDHHLTEYAATMPCEDFAETFHYYLRHKGNVPYRLHYKPRILAKWQFVEWLARRISRRHKLKVS